MSDISRITIKPEQCGGHPCIRGMRIRVKDVLDMLAEGGTEEEILRDYPDLEAEDIRASIAYAARYPRAIHQVTTESLYLATFTRVFSVTLWWQWGQGGVTSIT